VINIRNFAIIAHIDAGKSTLADRLLEATNTIDARLMHDQLLDSNPIERSRGITIKMAPVSMHYRLADNQYLLNLIDTPGHVDFNYEVERALQACEGAILLIDATKGVQAQTVANLRLAQNLNLDIVPAINKIDAVLADVPAAINQTKLLLPALAPLQISAKTGQGIGELIKRVIDSIRPSAINLGKPFRAFVFNSTFDQHLGVIAFVKICEGTLLPNQELTFMSSHRRFRPTEFGVFTPSREPKDSLSSGEVGYIVTNFKDIREVGVGDTICHYPQPINLTSLPGYRRVHPNLFLDIFLVNGLYKELSDAMGKLRLSDSSLEIRPISSPALGQGLRVGFLGLLHAEVTSERLQQEFRLDIITTSPSVEYKVISSNGEERFIANPADFDPASHIGTIYEPMAKTTIIAPSSYLGDIFSVCEHLRGDLIDVSYLDQLANVVYSMPLIEVITALHDSLKSSTSGYASVDYQIDSWREVNLTKLTVLLNGVEVTPLSILISSDQSQSKARLLADKLAQSIPRQQIEVAVQVTANHQIIARRTIKAFRKDVTAKLHGGDRTRRMKLLEKQKRGKQRMRQFGKVSLPPQTFLSILKLN